MNFSSVIWLVCILFDKMPYMQMARIIGGVVDGSEQTVTQHPWMRRDIGNPPWHEEDISLEIFGISVRWSCDGLSVVETVKEIHASYIFACSIQIYEPDIINCWR